jgi:hypothetical protein
MSGVSGATLALAIVTAGLVVVAFLQVRLARLGLDQSIRPLLADPIPRPSTAEPEILLFGAPGRASVSVPQGRLYFSESGAASFELSVPFENIGAGVATILAARTAPRFTGDVYISRKFAPVGATVRVDLSVLSGMPGSDRFKNEWWAMDGISVIIEYSDANEKQHRTSRAEIRQYATQRPFVQHISVTTKHWFRQTVTTGNASYEPNNFGPREVE